MHSLYRSDNLLQPMFYLVCRFTHVVRPSILFPFPYSFLYSYESTVVLGSSGRAHICSFLYNTSNSDGFFGRLSCADVVHAPSVESLCTAARSLFPVAIWYRQVYRVTHWHLSEYFIARRFWNDAWLE